MRFRLLTFLVLTPCLVLVTSQGLCDVSPGDVLDKTNWEKAEGLLPDEIIGWIKKGDFVVEIGELNYKLRDYLPPHALRASREKMGKYVLDENDWIVEKETGKRGKHRSSFSANRSGGPEGRREDGVQLLLHGIHRWEFPRLSPRGLFKKVGLCQNDAW